MITDGEPTAHIEPNGSVFFNYPPVPRDDRGDAARGDALHAGQHPHQHVHARRRTRTSSRSSRSCHGDEPVAVRSSPRPRRSATTCSWTSSSTSGSSPARATGAPQAEISGIPGTERGLEGLGLYDDWTRRGHRVRGARGRRGDGDPGLRRLESTSTPRSRAVYIKLFDPMRRLAYRARRHGRAGGRGRTRGVRPALPALRQGARTGGVRAGDGAEPVAPHAAPPGSRPCEGAAGAGGAREPVRPRARCGAPPPTHSDPSSCCATTCSSPTRRSRPPSACAPGTVKSTLHRARQTLREVLQP